MKIAHVCSFYTPAICGVKQVVEELAKRQIAAGHEVHVYTSDWDKTKRIKTKEEAIEGVHIHRCKHIARVANFGIIWPSVFFKILKEKFDIIHTHVFGHPHVVLAGLAAKIKKIPHIHTTHCPWSDAFRSTVGRMGVFVSYNLFSRFSLRTANKIIAITPWEVGFIKSYGGEESKIKVLPNGMAGIFSSRIENNNFKKKYQIKGNMVLFFGRLNVTKGPDKFIEIAKSILEERNDLVFVLRGPDEGMREKVKAMIGNEKHILLLEETRDRLEIAKMYQAADVYVLPSYREGLPLTLFEAMASGLPVVASPVNGIPYEMHEPENGFLVSYGDIDGFKKRILELIEDQKLREKISKNNRKKASRYNWEIIAQETLKIYQEEIDKYGKEGTQENNLSSKRNQ